MASLIFFHVASHSTPRKTADPPLGIRSNRSVIVGYTWTILFDSFFQQLSKDMSHVTPRPPQTKEELRERVSVFVALTRKGSVHSPSTGHWWPFRAQTKLDDRFSNSITMMEIIETTENDLKHLFNNRYHLKAFWDEILGTFFTQRKFSGWFFLSVKDDHPSSDTPSENNIVREDTYFSRISRSQTNPTEYLKTLVRSKCTKPEDPLAEKLPHSPLQAQSPEIADSRKRKGRIIPSPGTDFKVIKLESKFSPTNAEKEEVKIQGGLKAMETLSTKRYKQKVAVYEKKIKRKQKTISLLNTDNQNLKVKLKDANAKIKSLELALKHSQVKLEILNQSVSIKKRLLCNPDQISMDQTDISKEIKRLGNLLGRHLSKQAQLESLMNETLRAYNRKYVPKKMAQALFREIYPAWKIGAL